MTLSFELLWNCFVKVMKICLKVCICLLIYKYNSNVIPFSLTNFLKRFENPGPKIRGFFFDYFRRFKNLFFSVFLETKIQAELFSIVPSFIILKLLAFKVEPVDVISVINSEEPVNG
jgi:hypothetical protein